MPFAGELLQRPLNNDFHVELFLSLPQFVMHDVAAVSVQHAGQKAESAVYVDAGHIDVHVFMPSIGLHETGAVLRWSPSISIQPAFSKCFFVAYGDLHKTDRLIGIPKGVPLHLATFSTTNFAGNIFPY